MKAYQWFGVIGAAVFTSAVLGFDDWGDMNPILRRLTILAGLGLFGFYVRLSYQIHNDGLLPESPAGYMKHLGQRVVFQLKFLAIVCAILFAVGMLLSLIGYALG